MNEIQYPVNCPLMQNKEISKDICFDIHMVVSDTSPKSEAPVEIFKTENYKDVCNACKNHRYD